MTQMLQSSVVPQKSIKDFPLQANQFNDFTKTQEEDDLNSKSDSNYDSMKIIVVDLISLLTTSVYMIINDETILIKLTKERKLLLSLFCISSLMVLCYFISEPYNLAALFFLAAPLFMGSISFYKKLKENIMYGLGTSRFFK